MSKSAIKYINSCVSGKTADLLIGCINNDRIRKNWRNADVLARFLVDTVANAYQCENSTTFEDNGHTDMDDAISSYVEANLCDWDQDKFLASSFGKQTAQEISANLDEWRTKNAEFEAKQQPQSAQAAFESLDLFAQWNVVDEAHAEAISINTTFDTSFHRRAANWGAMDMLCREVHLERAHDEANTMNDGIDLAHRIITAMDSEPGSYQAARGCLMRDGFDDCTLLTDIGMSLYNARHLAQRERDRIIIRAAATRAANSFGHVIGEWEDLCEQLPVKYNARLSDLFDNLSGDNHKEIRKNFVKALHNLADSI